MTFHISRKKKNEFHFSKVSFSALSFSQSKKSFTLILTHGYMSWSNLFFFFILSGPHFSSNENGQHHEVRGLTVRTR